MVRVSKHTVNEMTVRKVVDDHVESSGWKLEGKGQMGVISEVASVRMYQF